jgi:hypothetical protein
LWDNEPAIRKERFREYARNAIDLLDEDINILLLALRGAQQKSGWAIKSRLIRWEQ